MSICRSVFLFILASLLSGCGKGTSETSLPDLHPVKGIVLKDGKPVTEGALMLRSDPGRPELVIAATIGSNGHFELTTMDTQDRTGKKNAGVPAGVYLVTYAPVTSDQTVTPFELTRTFTVETGKTNEWTIELAEKN